MRGLEMHLVFPYLTITVLFILSIMGIGQLVWERLDPSRRYRETWISRSSDYVMSVAYIGVLLSIPSIYFDVWKAGLPGPSASRTAQAIIFLFALSLSAAAWRVSAKPTIKLWKETGSLPLMTRGLWSLGAFSCPFLVPDVFDAWRGRREAFSFFRKLGNR